MLKSINTIMLGNTILSLYYTILLPDMCDIMKTTTTCDLLLFYKSMAYFTVLWHTIFLDWLNVFCEWAKLEL